MQLFDGKLVFDNPKPTKLIQRIIEISTSTNEKDFILDFFSGSSSTADAILQKNSTDKGNRRFICIQLNDPLKNTGNDFKANNVAIEQGYKNICEIGKERIRRAAKKIAEENPEAKFDGGFRVFKLDDTNMNDVYYSANEYSQKMLTMLESNVKSDRSDLDLLFVLTSRIFNPQQVRTQ